MSLNSDPFNSSFGAVDTGNEMWYTNGTKYDADNRVTEVKYDDSDTHKVNLTYDLLNRITNKTVTNGVPYSTNYTYVAGNTADYGANATTPLISTIEQGSGANAMNFAYTYDSRGNITSETRNGVTTTYEYDELGQLVRVNDPNDPAADSVRGTTWVYSYDCGGNILQKLAYVLSSDAHPSELRQSLIYEYTDANWKDKLTLFCNDELEYDAIGNLTDDGQWTYTWEKGRQLKSMHNANSGVTMEFKYNHEGIRTQKVKKVNGAVTETTDYILKGKLIAAMKKNTDTYYFTYDASGNLVVEYKYDAWGDAVSIYSASTTVDNLAFDNPFRYRGYVYDEETGFYYLRNRYYNSEYGRFINADKYLVSDENSLLGSNMFAYCLNNPIRKIDNNGNYSWDCNPEDNNTDNNPFNDIGGGGGPSSNVQYRPGITGNATSQSSSKGSLFTPDEFYTKNAPLQSTPNSSYIHYKYNDFTGILEKSTVYYDYAGRQNIRIDWTDHGYSDHGNPHVHFRFYNAQYRDGICIRMD